LYLDLPPADGGCQTECWQNVGKIPRSISYDPQSRKEKNDGTNRN
jgi:hypothetical protein